VHLCSGGLAIALIHARPSCTTVYSAIVLMMPVSFLCRFNIPGMNGREDWGRSEDDLMRARGAVDECLTTLGLAPAHFDEHLRTRVSAQHALVPKMPLALLRTVLELCMWTRAGLQRTPCAQRWVH
jgi:hypothetical protein